MTQTAAALAATPALSICCEDGKYCLRGVIHDHEAILTHDAPQSATGSHSCLSDFTTPAHVSRTFFTSNILFILYTCTVYFYIYYIL